MVSVTSAEEQTASQKCSRVLGSFETFSMGWRLPQQQILLQETIAWEKERSIWRILFVSTST